MAIKYYYNILYTNIFDKMAYTDNADPHQITLSEAV